MPVIIPRYMRAVTAIANDNINLAMVVEEVTLPVFDENSETFQPGGADGEIEIGGMGTKALTLGIKAKGFSIEMQGLFGGAPGVRNNFTIKQLITDEADGTEYEHMVDVKGRLAKIDAGSAQGGKVSSTDYEIRSIWTYTEYWNGQILHRFNLQTGGWDVIGTASVNAHRRSFIFS